jgi:hypothetical protein
VNLYLRGTVLSKVKVNPPVKIHGKITENQKQRKNPKSGQRKRQIDIKGETTGLKIDCYD